MNPIQLLSLACGCTPAMAATLLNSGVVSKKGVRNRAIRNRFNGLVRAGMPRMQAYYELSCEFDLSESSVMEVLKRYR